MKTLFVCALGGCMLLSGCTNDALAPRKGERIGTEDNKYASAESELVLSKATLEDKVLGVIVGSTIGLGSGWEYVHDHGSPVINIPDEYFEVDGNIATGTLGNNVKQYGPYDPSYYRVRKGEVKSDDDQTVNFFNMQVLKDYGTEVSYEDVSKAWLDYEVGDAAGGEDAVKIMKNKNYVAPFTGQNVFGNYYYACTEPWIGNTMLGVCFPGMPAKADSYLDIFASLTGDGDVLDLAKIFTLAYTYAMTENDARVCLEKAMSHVGQSNIMRETYDYVLECYENNPDDWRACVQGIFDRRIHNEQLYNGLSSMVSQQVNGGFMMTAIVFGENDFRESMKIASLAGYDGDCTAANVAGLLACCLGYSNLPQRYKDFLDKDSVYINDKSWFSCVKKNYPDRLTFGQLQTQFMENMEMFIKEFGGSISGDTVKVRAEALSFPPQPVVDDYGFEKAKQDYWTVDGNADFYISSYCAHSGKKAGTILISDKDTKISRAVNLIKGDTYSFDLFVYSTNALTFELFAEGDGQTASASFGNPLAGTKLHTRVNLTFIATAEVMNLGVKVFGKDSNTIFTIDDMIVKNISHKAAKSALCYDAETCYTFSGAETVKANTETGKAVKISKGAGIELTYTKDAKYYDSFRLYYAYKGVTYTEVRVIVDGVHLCNMPLLPKGEGKFDDGFAEIRLNLGEGEHKVRFQTISGNAQELTIDRIEIRRGDLLMHQ